MKETATLIRAMQKFALQMKFSGDDTEEPTQDTHSHSPAQQLRPRSEVIIYNKDGILGIKKKTYLLLPGGGIADGETPSGSVIREAMEEASAILKNLEQVGVVNTVYDRDNIISQGWDGEKTYFFTALYGGDAKANHPDKENFRFIPFDECISFLKELINDAHEKWASANNNKRLEHIKQIKKNISNPLMHAMKKFAETYASKKCVTGEDHV